eukprot:m.57728 g.57728  ORF g.57728 m.57728 type:complete len:204 (+) comp11625_c1_seq1:150-761(+)
MDSDDRSYYHGRITREEALERLEEARVDGTFLLRMSTSQEGVYTISVMQRGAVRHIRVVNGPRGGYALSNADHEFCPSIWQLISQQMNKTIASKHDAFDEISLRYPLRPKGTVIAPDLLSTAGEAGMDAMDFDDDVAAFLEGGVDTKELVRRRSSRRGPKKSNPMEDAMNDPDAERFMNGEITASELQRRRSVKLPRMGQIAE